MATRIDRSTPAAPSARTSSTTKAEAVAPAPQEATPATQPVAFSSAEPGRSLQPAGQHVSQSAEPAALWGAPPARRPRRVDVEAFQRLSPAERQAKLESLRAQQQQLGREIQDRVGQLDRRWGSARLTTRTASLRDLQARRPPMNAEQAQRFEAALKTAEAAEQQVDALAQRARALGPERRNDPAQRQALASALRRARAEHSAAVRAATVVVDEAGLKVDRLANAEQVLDPNAPAAGSGTSLWDKVTRFFELGWLLDVFGGLIDFLAKHQERSREHQKDTERSDREFALQLRQRLERAMAKEYVDALEVQQRRELNARLGGPRVG